jgi:hypothetical protein
MVVNGLSLDLITTVERLATMARRRRRRPRRDDGMGCSVEAVWRGKRRHSMIIP